MPLCPDALALRRALGHFATGVVAVTGIGPDGVRAVGLAANSFTSVSLGPPLVSFCVAHTSSTWPVLRKAGLVCVNILGEAQRGVCERLAAPGGDKFTGLKWSPATPAGLPVPDGTLAWLECTVQTEFEAGDHTIVLTRVRHLKVPGGDGPLLFYRGAYGGFRAGTGAPAPAPLPPPPPPK
ncbi:flavin reductase family protein [Streptomyces niveus]